jgi:hypothetical protein
VPEFYVRGTGFTHTLENVVFEQAHQASFQEADYDFAEFLNYNDDEDEYAESAHHEDYKTSIFDLAYKKTHEVRCSNPPRRLRWYKEAGNEDLCIMTYDMMRLVADRLGRRYAVIYGRFRPTWKTHHIVQDILITFKDAKGRDIETVPSGPLGDLRIRYFKFVCGGVVSLKALSVPLVTDPTLYCKTIQLKGRGGGWRAC